MAMINSLRLYLWIALGAVLWLNYQAWMLDYGPRAGAPAAAPGASANLAQPSSKPAQSRLDASIPVAPQTAETGAGSPAGESTTPVAAAPASGQPVAGKVHVLTDVLDLELSLAGGTLEQANLLAYPLVKGRPEPVHILNHDNDDTLYVVQTGLTGPGNAPRPSHLSLFASERNEYRMGSAAELRVPLTWTDDRGVRVTKTFIFRRGEYRIDLDYAVQNESSAPWPAAPYAQIRSYAQEAELSMFDVESYAFKGPAIYDGTKYRKLKIEDSDERLSADIKNGWLAALQHHFVTAIVPPKDVAYHYSLAVDGLHYQLAAVGPVQTIAPGERATFRETLFIGPKLQSQLTALSPELNRVADYGKLTIVSRPLFWLLNKVHALFNNWGVAIVVVTALLKLLFYPLSETSGRSMAKMKALAPRIKNLQETYKGDRDKLGREMMALYQREKVNPVAGCLPMIIQIPVFLAFYWVLLESVEMRQAPFFGWINDLSSRDPFFILPAIMAGAMFLQYKLNPAPPDPIQAKVFMIMPLAMSVMFAFFPAGLVLYWVTNTVLSIAQQWNINRRIAGAPAKRSPKSG